MGTDSSLKESRKDDKDMLRFSVHLINNDLFSYYLALNNRAKSVCRGQS